MKWERILNSSRKKKLFFITAAFVVFFTTYALVLPAITLDNDTASDEPGLNTDTISQEETNIYNTVYDPFSIEEERENAKNGNDKEDEILSGSEVREDVLYFFDKTTDVFVSVEAPLDAFPEGTVMVVTPIDEEEVLNAVTNTVEKVKRVQAVDITFYFNGEEIEPLKPIKVSLVSDVIKEAKDPQIVHIDDEGTGSLVEQADVETKEDEVVFESKDFSTYVVVETEIETTVITADGERYNITVSYDENAMIPEGAHLEAEEILPEDERYQEYYDTLTNELKSEPNYVRFFDISIMDGEEKVQPESKVNVKIELDDLADEENLKAVHIPDEGKPEVLDVQVNEETKKDTDETTKSVEFDAEGFSVYAIVETEEGDPSNTHSIKFLFFYGAEGNEQPFTFPNENGATTNVQYITTQETLENPGVPPFTSGSNQATDAFLGWCYKITEEVEGETVVTYIPYDFDKNLEENLTAFGLDEYLTDGVLSATETVNLYGAFSDAVYVYYYSQGTAQESGTQHTHDYDIHHVGMIPLRGQEDIRTVDYVPDKSTEAFLGWSLYTPAQQKTWIDANPSDNPRRLVISNANNIFGVGDKSILKHEDDTIYSTPEDKLIQLYPVIAEVYWVSFDKNDWIYTFDSKDGVYGVVNAVETTGGSYRQVLMDNEAFYAYVGLGLGTHNVTFEYKGNTYEGAKYSRTSIGASYVEPTYVLKGEKLTESAAYPDYPTTPVPTNKGYSFGGWYLEPECSTLFTESMIVSEKAQDQEGQTLTLYAKWIPDNAKYSIVVWKQRVTDDKNATDAEKTYDFAGSATIDNQKRTGEFITSADVTAYTNYSGRTNITIGTTTGINFTGFHYNSALTTAQNNMNNERGVQVLSDGTAVFNVYYDRHLMTITFDRDIEVYGDPDDPDATVYGLVDGEYIPLQKRDDGTYFYEEEYEDTEDTETIYVLTNTLSSGNRYLIVNYNTEGARYALSHNGTNVRTDAVTVKQGITQTNNAIYISSSDVDNASIWTASNGFHFANGGYYIRRNGNNLSFSTNSNQAADWTYYESDSLRTGGTLDRRFISWRNNTFDLEGYGAFYSHPNVYLYVEREIHPIKTREITYDGEVYAYTTTRTFTGLYEQPLSMYGYTWPVNYLWYCAAGPHTQTLLNDFTIPSNGVTINNTAGTISYSLQAVETGSSAAHHLRQDLSGKYTIEQIAYTSGGSFTLSNKYRGFTVIGYSHNNHTEDGPNNSGNPGTSAGNSYPVYIYHQRNIYDLAFKDTKSENVFGTYQEYFEADLTKYASASYYPSASQGYTGYEFTGWYTDDTATEYIFFKKASDLTTAEIMAVAEDAFDREQYARFEVITQAQAEGRNDVIEQDGKYYKFKYTTIEKMDAANLQVYAGWRIEKYRVWVQANGGQLVPGDMATYFNNTYDQLIREYQGVYRNYIPGTPTNTVNNPERFAYLEIPDSHDENSSTISAARLALYVTKIGDDYYYYPNSGNSSGNPGTRLRLLDRFETGSSTYNAVKAILDGFTEEDYKYVYKYEGYSLVGWYKVDKEVTKDHTPLNLSNDPLTAWNFGDGVHEVMALRAVWKRNGYLTVTYNAVVQVGTDDEGQPIVIHGDIRDVSDIDYTYTDNANGVAVHAPIIPAEEAKTWVFVGWKTPETDSENIYKPGDVYTIHADYAQEDPEDEYHFIYTITAVYKQIGTSSITYNVNADDATGTTLTDLGHPVSEYHYSESTETNTIGKLKLNSDVVLSDGSGFIRPGYELIGWNDNQEAAYLGIVKFLLGGTYGVSEETNTLYAVWSRAVTVEFTKKAQIEAGNDNTAVVKPGVEFTIYSDAACTQDIETVVSDQYGKVIFEIAEADINKTFYMKETSTLDGYVANNEVYTITVTMPDRNDPSKDTYTITGNGDPSMLSGEQGSYVIMNVLENMDITIIKVDKNDPTVVLQNAKFKLLKWSSTDGRYVSIGLDNITAGSTLISNLGTGYYELIEYAAPDGYIVYSGSTYFCLDVMGQHILEKKISLNSDNEEVVETVTNEMAVINDTDKKISVLNEPGTELPMTGGPGTAKYMIFGSILMAGSLMYEYSLRRKNRKEVK